MASAGSLIGYGTFRYLLFSASLSASLHLQPCAFAELLHTPRAAFAGRKISHYRTEVVVGWRIAHQIDVGLREARVLRLRLIIDCSAAGHRQRDDDVDLVALLFPCGYSSIGTPARFSRCDVLAIWYGSNKHWTSRKRCLRSSSVCSMVASKSSGSSG